MKSEKTLVAAHTEQNPARNLTWCYLLALGLVAFFVVGSQIWLQPTIAEMEDHSRIINIAGRQRMLSQKITKTVLQLDRAPADEEKARVAGELAEAFSQWSDAHRFLIGNYQGSDTLRTAYQDLDVSFSVITAEVRQILAADGAVTGQMIDRITTGERSFLTRMEEIVGLYEQEVYRLGSLRKVELGMAAAALLILFLEALFIFRPLSRIIRRQFDALRESHARLDEARSRAEQASESKTRFISYLSHEIRNPVNAIAGFAELLTRSTLPDEKRQRFTRVIVDNCAHLTKLTNDAIDAAVIESGKLKLQPGTCDPRSVVAGVIALLEEEAAKKNLRLAMNAVEPLPAEIRTDVTRFRQILINLISNAIKFTSSGGAYICVEMSAPDLLSVSVVDTGEGMTSTQLAQLFYFFNRLRLADRETSGGIGLAVSKELAVSLGGNLTVSSVPGQGSTFRLTIATNLTISADMQADSSVARIGGT
jgi:signal transduction histidine kinase